MKNVLSRYRLRFVRSLIYLLQASEYDVRDYLAWYRRTADFSLVEKRKQLDRTQKALALLYGTWAMLIVWVAAVMGFSVYSGFAALVVGTVIILLLPFYLPYAILVPLFVLHLVQKPLEARLIREAKAILNRHKGARIAVAGSYGKTTTREILKTVLSAGLSPHGGKKVAAPQGSYNTPLGIASFVKSLKGDEDVLIFELGEYYPGDIKKLCGFVEPHIGIITGVNEAHLEKFGTLENTAATIFELADYLAGKPLYINAENETACAKSAGRRSDADRFYSREGVISPAGEWRVVNPHTDLKGTTFTLVRGGDAIHASSKLLGLHMIGPLAAAADIAREFGLSVAEIEEGIKRTTAFAHRLEPHVDNTGVITLDDSYNGNPDGVAAVIAFLASLKGRRRFYVTPGLVEMGARKEAVHENIGKQLAQAGIEKIILIRTSVTPFIEKGLGDHGSKGHVQYFDDMPAALSALTHMTVSGDVVLIQNDWPDQYV